MKTGLRVMREFLDDAAVMQKAALSIGMKGGLVLYPDSGLTALCGPVTEFVDTLAIVTAVMQKVVIEYRGYALAAPQVGIQRRFFVIADHPDLADQVGMADHPSVVINPVLTLLDQPTRFKESCLSLPGISAWNLRHQHVRCAYQDLTGAPHEFEAHGVLAVVLQHEVDHLDGKLFVDQLNTFERGKIQRQLNKMRPRR